jgi:hypothetical protein
MLASQSLVLGAMSLHVNQLYGSSSRCVASAAAAVVRERPGCGIDRVTRIESAASTADDVDEVHSDLFVIFVTL